jgi:hypothetical protein
MRAERSHAPCNVFHHTALSAPTCDTARYESSLVADLHEVGAASAGRGSQELCLALHPAPLGSLVPVLVVSTAKSDICNLSWYLHNRLRSGNGFDDICRRHGSRKLPSVHVLWSAEPELTSLSPLPELIRVWAALAEIILVLEGIESHERTTGERRKTRIQFHNASTERYRT